MVIIPGVYQLLIRVRHPTSISVGALDVCLFPAGWYVYTGSARGGLTQRISRHLRDDKRMHWHIDYLLSVAESVNAFVLPGRARSECRFHADLSGGEIIVPGFGSSDCHCRSHLAHFKRRPDIKLMPWTLFLREQRRWVSEYLV